MITSDPDVRRGRWCIDGTRIDVLMLRTNSREWLIENYKHVPVTHEMIDEALAFEFKPIQGAELDIVDWDLTCVCGESYWESPTSELVGQSYGPGEYVRVCKACGKRWKVTIGLEAVG